MPVKSLYWMELESQSQQFTQSPWSDRAAQIVKAVGSVPRTCRIRTIFMVRSAALAIRLSTSGVHPGKRSKGSTIPTWCSSSDRIRGFQVHHMVPIQRSNPAVLILPLGVHPTAKYGSCYLTMWQLLPCFLCNLL
jgi:hypothetical protein